MEQHWERLGAMLKRAREDLGITQHDAAERLGVKRNALGTIEGGKAKRVTTTIRRYAELVRWAPGSVERILAGGDPELAPQAAEASRTPANPSAWGFVPRVAEELTGGRVIDQSIVDVTADGSLAVVMLLIERGAVEVPAGQVAADLREWSRKQRAILKALTADDSSVADS